jgi:hypothetical protein
MSNGIDPTFPANASPAGATDNPGGANVAGGGVQTETGRPTDKLLGVPSQGSDNTVAGAIPSSGGGGASRTNEHSADPSGGVTTEPDGSLRVAGEGETAGSLGSESGKSPSAFPGQ